MLNFFKKKLVKATPSGDAVQDIIRAIRQKTPYIHSSTSLNDIEAYEQLKQKPEDEQKALILQLLQLVGKISLTQARSGSRGMGTPNGNDLYYKKSTALAILNGLIRKKLNYTEEEWMELFKNVHSGIDQMKKYKGFYYPLHLFPVNYAIKQIEYHLKKHEPSPELTSFIQGMLEWDGFKNPDSRSYYGSDLRKAAQKLQAILYKDAKVQTFKLKTDDIGDAVNQIIASVTDSQEHYVQIFHLASGVSGAKPSKKFSSEIHQLQDEIGPDAYRKIAHQLMELVTKHQPKEQTTVYEYSDHTYEYRFTTFLSDPSQQFIKGIVWTLNRFSDKETIRLLTQLCEKTYTKIPGKGPAAASVGNACVWVLGNMRGKDGLGALSRLKLKLRQNNIKKTIDKYLLEGAKKYNVSVEELKEMAVPDFRLVNGCKTIAFEDYQLVVRIVGKKVTQQWIKPDGNPMKSVPSVVKNSTALSKQLKEVRKEVKEIQKVFAAQKQRIDNQFILDRSWDFPSFDKYYLQHGLVSPISEKLIWTFSRQEESIDAILMDGQWQDFSGNPIDWIDKQTTVKLWHPVNADEATIVSWREKMMELQWQQPIKQAFREIYLLTDAELNTRSYSNRMAAHILKQHQFNSLANLRGWKYGLLGAYDDGRYNEVCSKYLPEYKITAEFWVDELNQDDNFNDTGIWLYITTDQVKFKNESGETMQLVDVPKMVFTEIMRDVDLFVGVCSVGNDPLWMDNNGERQTNRDYWTTYSFGDLSEIAKTRKTILERLLPRLKKIREVARIDGKFLVVEGKLRTYKIHIGSGNILMEPNDQYLCIVPARSADKSADRIFIPFEGDRGLSIVLSKAFLLAEDDKITDTTITRQIGRGK